jgi:hypothetical protein
MTTVRRCAHEGLAAVEVVTPRARLVVTTEVGPRVAWFGLRSGRNLLFWDAANEHTRGAWRLRGGHRVWLTRPLADEAEETYAADERPCAVRTSADGVTVTAPPEPSSQVQRSIAIRALSPRRFRVVSRVRNAGDMLWSGGVWALTCTRPARATTYEIPLGDGSAWDVFNVVIPKRWAGHTSKVDDPQLAWSDERLVVRPRGVECKRMLQVPRGLMTMRAPDAGVAFEKRSPYVPGAAYPLGANLAFYVGPGNFMVEMESMGPAEVVKPGATLSLTEEWSLL